MEKSEEKVCSICLGTGEIPVEADVDGEHHFADLGDTIECPCQEQIAFEE